MYNLRKPFFPLGIRANEFYIKLSEKYHQTVIHVGFNEEVIKQIVFRDIVAANVFIFGDKTVISNALQMVIYRIHIYYIFC